MAIIIPDSEVLLLKGLPLENKGSNTYSFINESFQREFFKSKAAYTFLDFTPVRLQQAIKVRINANQLYDCNYMMFRNKTWNSKWFYAFIDRIEWDNVSVATIYYTIDEWQTWFFECNFLNSFVERCHASTDEPGDNLILENLELGDYIVDYSTATKLFDEFIFIVFSTVNKSFNPTVGSLYGGIYSGLAPLVFETYGDLNNWLKDLVQQNKQTAVVSIIMFPSKFVQGAGTSTKINNYKTVKQTGNIDGYVPKNNKLFTDPYCHLLCTNIDGTAGIFRYEFFSTTDCEFKIYMDMSANPTAILVPQNYKGISENWSEKVAMNGFPQCSWNSDTYKAWLAQNGSSMAISTLGTAFQGATALSYGNISGAVGSALNIAQTVAQVKVTQSLPPQSHGTPAPNALVAAKKKDFYFYRQTVTREMAEVIDNYFSMYGYAQHKLMPIEFRTRENYNYIKTIDANITGNVPQSALTVIKERLNSGITVWHGDYLGDYTKPNNIRKGGV